MENHSKSALHREFGGRSGRWSERFPSGTLRQSRLDLDDGETAHPATGYAAPREVRRILWSSIGMP
ncbi:hypothetical protein [Solimonas sp. K1W22B-7]|uniref:hypothetical protein n=1 Tax=Solimonas sp. K1W22B-7 TaxID=2303331 RepID=UPI0013C46E9A|nr:hypothetical protein [Solimonas sp. K1W22B-7]